LLAGMHLSQEDFTELCRQLENLFFAYIIAREPTKEFERSFARWATEVRSARSRADLDAFLKIYFWTAKENLTQRYKLAFEQLREDTIQKYRMRYVLAKLTQFINEQAYGSTEADITRYINSQVDIEHILPQHPAPAVLADFDKPDELTSYVPRLGNLTLLEKSINSSVGNGLFAAKRDPYRQSKFLLTKTVAEPVSVGVDTAIDRAVKGLITFDKWNSESIEMRQLMLADLARRVWDMP
jgi:hypothetical protein